VSNVLASFVPDSMEGSGMSSELSRGVLGPKC
jgi:hypothetical protein